MQSKSIRATAAAAALCCAGLAHAQSPAASSLTLYGLLDVAVTSVSGLKQGSVNQLASGVQDGSRFGLRGSEDIGGGYRAVFTLENRLEIDNGSQQNAPITGNQLTDTVSFANLMGLQPLVGINATQAATLRASGLGACILPGNISAATQCAVTAIDNSLAGSFSVNAGATGNRLFDRQAFVGLVTPYGAVLLGRQYTPAFEVDATFDVAGTSGSVGAGSSTPFPPAIANRIPNSLVYRLQQGGISAAVMYGFGESATATVGSEANSLIGVNVIYRAKGWSVGFGYNGQKNELAQDALQSTVIGATAALGPGTFHASIVQYKNDNFAGLSGIQASLTPLFGAATGGIVQTAFKNALRQDGIRTHLGYKYVTGPHTLLAAFNQNKDNTPLAADVTTYGGGYKYAFSKRTEMYGYFAHTDNSDNAQVALGGNGFFGGVTEKRGVDSDAIAIGLQVRF